MNRIGLCGNYFSIEYGTGIGRYSLELYNGLLKNEFFDVCMLKHNIRKMPCGMVINHLIESPLNAYRNKDKIDIFHAMSPLNAISFLKLNNPGIVTFHDLITPLYKPKDISLQGRTFSSFLYKLVAKNADSIISDSSQTTNDLMSFSGVDHEKITTIPLGVDKRFKPITIDKDDCYNIGYLGDFSTRKRLDYLVMSFYNLKQTTPSFNAKLYICGKFNNSDNNYLYLKKLVNQLQLWKDIIFTGYISEERLVEMYNFLDVLVIPSDSEGFCLPLLEAQKCGVPTIIRRDAEIPAEVSKCCIKINNYNDFSEQITKLYTDDAYKNRIIKDGVNHSRQFTWEKTIEMTIKVYESYL